MRNAFIERKTAETDISLSLTLLDRSAAGKLTGSTGIPFFDHMLSAVCVHGSMNMDIKMRGDLEVDSHHSIEDFGLVFGTAFAAAAGDKAHLCRYGFSYVPMDESLSRCALDISARPYLVFKADFDHALMGTMETAMVREFFYAFAMKSGITLHLENLYGHNDHHKAESLFKAFARALGDAMQLRCGDILSTKGSLA